MTATLRLTPLSREECSAILKKKGKILTSGDGCCPPATGEEHARNTITLKLCSHTDDIIDVDDDDGIMPEVVKHALKYEDGSTAATTILGRQKGTGIKCVAISRALCDVSLAEKSSSSPVASMRMRKPPNAARPDGELAKTSHHVHLDGELVRAPLGEEIPLTNGSIVALYGATGFAYQVIFQNDDGDAADAEGARRPDFVCRSPKRKRPHPEEETLVEKKRQPTERERIRQRAHKVMEEEFTCAMCMDILVKSTFAFPCSHAFCEKCSKSIVNAAAAAAAPIPSSSAAADTVSSSSTKGKCPTCRGDVLEWMPARSYDTQVWSFALQGCFEKTDAEDFLERRQLVGEDPPTEEERGSILNIGEGEGGDTTDKKETEHTAKCQYVASLSNKQPETTNFIRTLPRLNSTEMISNANNGIQVVNLAAYNYRVKSADNDVICID